MDHPRLRDGWAAWALVLAAALPTAVTIGLGWLAFSGSWDSLPARSRSTTGRELLAYRWSDFWFSTPATTLLLTSLLPLLVLAVAALVDRPRFLFPTGAGRKAATTVGAVCTCLGLIEMVGFPGQLTGLLPVQSWGALTSSELVAFAPFAVVAFSYLVVSAVVTAVLWPRGDGEPTEGPPPTVLSRQLSSRKPSRQELPSPSLRPRLSGLNRSRLHQGCFAPGRRQPCPPRQPPTSTGNRR